MLQKEPGGVWQPLDRNPLHPRIPFPSLWGVDYFWKLLSGRPRAGSQPAGNCPRPSHAVAHREPTISTAPACLCHRFAEQAVFTLFCMFAILLFSRDPKFIPGWASFFTPG